MGWEQPMNAYENAPNKGNGSSIELEQRDVRALTEYQSVLPNTGRAKGADDLFLVVSQSGSEYLVDVRERRCECPDHQHRENECKHLRRVAYATGEKPIPECVNIDAVDPQLGEHVETRVATDGGEATDDVETNDEGRPDDCTCIDWNVNEGPPCWPCYREGFEDPATDETEEEDTFVKHERADFRGGESTGVQTL